MPSRPTRAVGGTQNSWYELASSLIKAITKAAGGNQQWLCGYGGDLAAAGKVF